MGTTESAFADAVSGSPAPTPDLVVEGLTKRYGGVLALDQAKLEVAAGEVHALLGENGAGKSTLVKIAAGISSPDSGSVTIAGVPVERFTPLAVRNMGIGIVHQELSLFSNLSVAHNLLLTRIPRNRIGMLDLRAANELAAQALAELGITGIDPRTSVSDLPLDRQQMVEIAKVIGRSPRILIMDEATSSLAGHQVERLFEVLSRLKADGRTVMLISHRMEEVWNVADRLTVLRDGRTVASYPIGEATPERAVRDMAGRDVRTAYPTRVPRDVPAATSLEFRDIRLTPLAPSWDLTLARGEVLGIGGLEGQGQREFLQWLYGLHRASGKVLRNGQELRLKRPQDALKAGIAFIPENRKVEGLHLTLPIRWNLAMATLSRRSTGGFIRFRAEKKMADAAVERMSIKLDSLMAPVSALSGGTQQKVVLGKFMATEPEVLIFMDPTRGVDVRTKFEFYDLLNELVASGKACILYSSDTAELAGVSSRVAVFRGGAVVSVLEGSEITNEGIVAASFAVERGAA